jgi:hypothetical protein
MAPASRAGGSPSVRQGTHLDRVCALDGEGAFAEALADLRGAYLPGRGRRALHPGT